MRSFDSLLGDLYNDQLYSGGHHYPSKPFWTVFLSDDDDKILADVMARYRAFYIENRERIERMRFNLCAYMGLQYFRDDIRLAVTEGLNPRYVGETPKITSNLLQSLVDQQVSNALLYPPDIAVVPQGTGFKNSIHAETIKEVLDSIDLRINKQRNLEILHRRARLFGEAYRFIFWNPDAGDVLPAYKRQKEKKGAVTIALDDGREIRVDREVRIGDVDEVLPHTWDVGLDPKTYVGYSEWTFVRCHRPVDELKVDYPDIADEILPTAEISEWNTDIMTHVRLKDHALVVEFYHRRTPYLPQGAKVCFTPDVILYKGPIPGKEVPSSLLGDLPLERLTDVDIEGSLHGWSKLQNINQLQNQYDNSTTLIGRNIFLGAHPKWFMPRGACNINRLLNKTETVVQFAGPVAPALVTFPTVGNEVFAYKDNIKADMREIYNVFSTSRGEPPKGVTANAALQFLDAQQEQANTLGQIKHNQLVIATHQKRLSIIAENYDKADKRVTRILGEDRSWYTKIFDTAALADDYEVVLNISSDLPLRKDARMQTVFQMSQIWPTLYPPEAVAYMFNLGHAKKFIAGAQAAYQAAESENYRASRSMDVDDPEPFEDLIVHWKSHYKQMQMPQFKEWPEEAKKILKTHLLVTEWLMYKKLDTNPMFAAAIQALQVFPILLPLPEGGASPTVPAPGGMMLPQMAGGGPEQTPQQPKAEKVPQASLNQGRNVNGQFGQGVSAIQ